MYRYTTILVKLSSLNSYLFGSPQMNMTPDSRSRIRDSSIVLLPPVTWTTQLYSNHPKHLSCYLTVQHHKLLPPVTWTTQLYSNHPKHLSCYLTVQHHKLLPPVTWTTQLYSNHPKHLSCYLTVQHHKLLPPVTWTTQLYSNHPKHLSTINCCHQSPGLLSYTPIIPSTSRVTCVSHASHLATQLYPIIPTPSCYLTVQHHKLLPPVTWTTQLYSNHPKHLSCYLTVQHHKLLPPVTWTTQLYSNHPKHLSCYLTVQHHKLLPPVTWTTQLYSNHPKHLSCYLTVQHHKLYIFGHAWSRTADNTQ
ncbi:hypothetical protein J6590_033360 [Homalodisca vitripennis]|nr:hypothetical protein J6590_033360 [Homalodisca vitripennis]